MIMRMSSRQMRSKWEKTNFAIYVKKWGAFCDLVYYDLIRLKRAQTGIRHFGQFVNLIENIPVWEYNKVGVLYLEDMNYGISNNK